MVCDNLGRIWYENVVLHLIYWIILSLYIFLDFETVNSFKKKLFGVPPGTPLVLRTLSKPKTILSLSLSLSLSPLISILLQHFSLAWIFFHENSFLQNNEKNYLSQFIVLWLHLLVLVVVLLFFLVEVFRVYKLEVWIETQKFKDWNGCHGDNWYWREGRLVIIAEIKGWTGVSMGVGISGPFLIACHCSFQF